MDTRREAPRTERYPFDVTGIERDAAQVARYTTLTRSLVAMLRAAVLRGPRNPAVAEIGGGSVTYEELWERAARLAGGLRADGLRAGARVAITLPSGVDWVVAFFGIVLAGAVAVPVNTRFTAAETEYVCTDAGAARILGPGEPWPDGTPFCGDEPAPDAPAAIFYTSGTTGRPKGAVLTEENIAATVETARRVVPIAPGEGPTIRNLVAAPLFHVTGCVSQLLVQVGVGGLSVIQPRFSVQGFLRAIVDHRITSITHTPAVYNLVLRQENLADFALDHVGRVAYGAAPVSPALVERIAACFPNAWLANGFGLTETSSISTYLPHEFAREHAATVGFPAPVVDVAVDRPHPVDGVGELLIRGPHVMAGYWNAPEATAGAFVDGWFRTGDLGRTDEHGLVSVTDRLKDVINRGGENVYSVEVENVLATAPGVAEVAVVAVPDDVMGEKVGAVIVPGSGATIDEAALLTWARERLADFKVPEHVRVSADPLPRNPAGKIAKSTVRERFATVPTRR